MACLRSGCAWSKRFTKANNTGFCGTLRRRFPTLLDVVNHYDSCKGLGLSTAEKSNLVQFLVSMPNTTQ